VNEFVQRHASSVIGTLSGFDRLLFRGTLLRIANAGGLVSMLCYLGVLLKDFGDWSMALTEQLKAASLAAAARDGRPARYLPDPSVRKEDVARDIARADGIEQGRVCVLSSVESCWSYEVHRDATAKKLQLQARPRRCLHLYHYQIHPRLGFMHTRLQTWLPFNLWVNINGREWLGRQLDAAGVGYRRHENCFTHVDDVAAAQALLDEQVKVDWAGLLGPLGEAVNPARGAIVGHCDIEYYWSLDQSEWATDVMFKRPGLLAALYPRLVRHGIETLGSRDVLRFLGRRVPEAGNCHPSFTGQVASDLKQRPEGVRLEHRVNANSVKMYDKQDSVLRVETTINDPADFKVYRGTAAEPGKRQWRKLRKGVADLHRRAQVSQAANDRYLQAMAPVTACVALKDLAEPLCRPVRGQKKTARALNPLSRDDAALLEAVARGEFTLNGFRNRDLRALLFNGAADPVEARRRRSGQVTRKLRLLRAHGLVRKVPRTHRYLVTDKGRRAITALLAARAADADALAKAA
jgi:hypothetical protein